MAYNTRKPPIDAAMLRLRKVSHQDEPTRLSIFDSKGEMDFWCLRDYCQDLALRGTKWECNKLASGPVRELPVFEVTDSEPIHEANAAAAEKEVNDVQKALSALSLLSPRIKPQPKRPSAGKPKASGGGGKKPSPKPKSKSKIMELEELLEMSQSSGSAALAVDSEEEESEAETSKPEHVVIAASQRGSASSSSSMPAPVVHPPPPAPVAGRPEPRVGRTTKKRSQAWGTFPAFQIGPIVSHGVCVGFGAVCGRHHNPGVSLMLVCIVSSC